ncbi:MAG: ABC transporter permease [Pseudomonadota bacterium]|nr:ABC transporter permease [Pseudomonadota bacterium]
MEPIVQLTLLGFAINNDPRPLPIAVLRADRSAVARSLIAGMQETDYFHVLYYPNREEEAKVLLRRGDVQFVLAVPEGFSRKLVRGDFPAVLLEIDATDPAAASNAVAAVNTLAHAGVPADGARRRTAALSTHPGLKGMGGPGTAAVAS